MIRRRGFFGWLAAMFAGTAVSGIAEPTGGEKTIRLVTDIRKVGDKFVYEYKILKVRTIIVGGVELVDALRAWDGSTQA